MSADLAVWVAAVGAIGSLASATLAYWLAYRNRSMTVRMFEVAMRRAGEGGQVRPTYDVFLTYASADSKDLARQLADALRDQDLNVWLDQDQIHVGDNAFEKIGEGLSSSRFGLVILSPRFPEGRWAEQELRALLRREGEGRQMILPVWNGVSEDDVGRFAPELAAKHALISGAESVDEIASDIAEIASKTN